MCLNSGMFTCSRGPSLVSISCIPFDECLVVLQIYFYKWESTLFLSRRFFFENVDVLKNFKIWKLQIVGTRLFSITMPFKNTIILQTLYTNVYKFDVCKTHKYKHNAVMQWTFWKYAYLYGHKVSPSPTFV